MFILDRDLLPLEPLLFRDVAWASQRPVSGIADIAGTTLTATLQDSSFTSAGVEPGFVLVLEGAAYEVIAVHGHDEVEISQPRPTPESPALPPPPATGRPFQVITFRPQIAAAHAQLLTMLGLAEGSPGAPAITNPGELRRPEALLALSMIYGAASVLSGKGSPLAQRAAHYRRLFARERHTWRALLDLDGDGLPDATRRLNILQLVRA